MSCPPKAKINICGNFFTIYEIDNLSTTDWISKWKEKTGCKAKKLLRTISQNRKVYHSTLDGSYIKQKRIMRNRQAIFIRLVRNLESISMFAIGEEWNAENRLSFFCFFFGFYFCCCGGFCCCCLIELVRPKFLKNVSTWKTSQTADNRTRITQKSADVFIYISLTHVLRLQSLNLRFDQSFSMQLPTKCSKRQFITKIFFTERF